ncbi:MAG: T9SS type A sorting domain-containing protein [Bacteroidales bacterium]|nr:T9SS type A sorting domain-containing protein [Bacteroidales bacterium]
MKNSIVIILAFLSISTFGQVTLEQAKINTFGNLDTEKMYDGILINSSVIPIDMSEFSVDSATVINADLWLKLYAKIYSAFLSEPKIPTPKEITEIYNQNIKNSVIPLGLFYFKYSSIKEDAIDKGLLRFENDVLYETFENDSPYEEQECLAFSPLLLSVNSTDIQFVLNDELLFNNTGLEISKITIDFADGFGMQNISSNEVINISYDSYGEKKITGNIVIGKKKYLVNTSIIVGDEQVQLKSGGDDDFGDVVTPDDQYDIQTTYNSSTIKGKWGVFYGCDENLNKPVIVIEGFDPLDSKNLSDGEAKNNLYAITDTKQHLLNNLRNAGYDIVILDFDNNNIDLRASGKLAAELIKEVNLQKQGENELVVMGRSGGGLLARYALAYLEENDINHQTRLLLTIDAPNQGANIPLGFQHFIKYTVNSTVLMGVIGVLGNYLANDMLDKTLNSTYAKQMLFYHHSETNKSNKKANPSNDRANFVNDLNSQNGGYPENLLKIAISDGSRSAQNQGFGFEANLLRWDLDVGPCPVTRLTNQVNALPDKGQTGEIIKSKIEVRFPIVPCLVYSNWVETLCLEIEINNANPYDNSPGGNAGWHRLNVNSFMPDWSNNLLTYLAGVSVEDDFECFVPVVSALDLNSNILPSEHGGLFYNVDANLSNNSNISRVGNFFYNLSPPTVSPFDVMYASSSNQEHAESNSEWTSLFEGEIYPTNLYLQNQEITHDRVYYARNSITAGNNVTTDLPQGEFVIKSGSKVKMTSGGSITLSPGFSAELGSEFIATIHEETNCNIASMSSLKSAKIISDNQEVSEIKTANQNPLVDIITSTEKSISVYPNPANTTLIVFFNKYSDEKINVKIFDNSGKQISSIKNANRITEINVSDFQPGFYTVLISHGKEVYSEKFIKQ